MKKKVKSKNAFYFLFLNLKNLQILKNVKLPQTINGSLNLRSIKEENILNLPEEIGEFFDIPDLKGKECLEGLDISCVKDKRKIRYINKEYESAQSILEKFMKS